MNKNQTVVIAGACVFAILGGAAIGVFSTKDDMPVQVEQTTAAASAAVQNFENETKHEFYTDENGETVTFPVPDGTVPSSTSAATQAAETTKKSLIDNLFGEKATEAITEIKTTITTAVTTKAEAKQTTQASSAASETTVPTSAAAVKSGKIPDYEYAYAGLNPDYAEITSSNWNLMLVNRDYILPDGYVPTLAPSITSDSSSCKLDYRVAPHYNEMYLAAKADGIILTPVSGYRSMDRQRNNLNNKIAYYQGQGFSKEVATQKAVERILPPGTSEHNAGMAMDIITADSTAGFQYTKEYKWLDQHAADYGFILRYPENKQNKTKIIYEPWHWRYVGVEAAKAMKASGQCLEEYLGKA